MHLPGISNYTSFGPRERNISRGRFADGILVSLSSLLSRPGVTCLPDREGCLGTGRRGHAHLEGPTAPRASARQRRVEVGRLPRPASAAEPGPHPRLLPKPVLATPSQTGVVWGERSREEEVGGIRCCPEVTCRGAPVRGGLELLPPAPGLWAPKAMARLRVAQPSRWDFSGGAAPHELRSRESRGH